MMLAQSEANIFDRGKVEMATKMVQIKREI